MLSDDESVIETMEQHKKLANGKLSHKIKCSSGNKQWEVEDLLEWDVPEMVKEHKIKNCLGSDEEETVQAIPASLSAEADVATTLVCASLL